MSTKQPTQSPAVNPVSQPFAGALARVRDFLQRLVAPAAPAAPAAPGTSDLWQLYRMSRGSDSLRPALVRKLDSGAGR